MPWAALDDSFHDDPRIVEVGLAAAGLYACATTYCARHLTDGWIPAAALARFLGGGDASPVAALTCASLLAFDKRGQRYEVVGFFPANRTRAQVAEAKAKGKRASDARWNKPAS